MNDTATEALLAIIKDEWLKISEKRRHWAVWIREYAPIQLGADEVVWQSYPERVWILESRGLREENVWKWHRYTHIHARFPSINARSSDTLGHRGMGFAAFAPYTNTDNEYYLEYQWDGCWGRGWHVTVNADGRAELDRELWIS